MGLDMYLKQRKYISAYKNRSHATKMSITTDIEFDDGTTETQTFKAKTTDMGISLDIPVCYWRKVNAVHKWFLDATEQEEDNCQDIDIQGSKILELVDLCKQVLDDHSKASELLPTQDGFFFGSTEYDDYYFDDIQYTYDSLKDNIDPEEWYVYRASW